MPRYISIILLAVVVGALTALAPAQTGAAASFEQGKAAYSGGRFTEARDLFLKASQTDTRNPEVFLWLGKAQYQLGMLDEAIAAWTKTLKLAPEEPYARKMLNTLRGQFVETDTRINLIEAMLKEELFHAVKRECGRLLKDRALTEPQRVKIMTLQAEASLIIGGSDDALRIVHELLIRYPKLADPAITTLLLGRAKIRHEKNVREGLLLLRKVVTDYKGTPSAVVAQYELVVFDLEQGVSEAGARELAEWIGANLEHSLAKKAAKRLVDAYMELGDQRGKVRPEAGLGKWEKAALATAASLFERTVRTEQVEDIVAPIIKHLDMQYAKSGAYGAAIGGCEVLLEAKLPSSARLHVLKALGGYKSGLAIDQLGMLARAGRLAAGPVPDVLSDVLATYGIINEEFAAQAVWGEQSVLAERLRKLDSKVPWPARVTEPKAAYAWAVDIALPVVKAGVDSGAVSRAIKTIRRIVEDCAGTGKAGGRSIALAINSRLLEVLAPTNRAWAAVMLRQVDLLSAEATAVFNDNIQSGRADENAELSEPQKQYLITLAKLVEHQASRAQRALEELSKHLQPWTEYGHYKVAEQAYLELAPALPEAQRRQAKLGVAKLWRQQVINEHNRLAAAGVTVPSKLNPVLTKALELCYSLQDGLDEDEPFLIDVREVYNSIVTHYKRLEYFDTAGQAIKVKPSETVTLADDYANLQLANLKFELAQRDLRLLLKKYNASTRVSLIPAFKSAIEDYTKFISERPSSKLRDEAVSKVFQIAKVFERHKAYDVAVGVYRDFAAFAANIKALSQAAPGSSSPAERAAFAAARALDAKARKALSEQMEHLKDRAAVPAKISDEFAAAVEAYKGFIKACPQSPLIGQAIVKIMAIALEYAKIDAWDVADSVYAELMQKDLAVRRLERIEFCRGLSQLGKAIPGHAKEVLTTLSLREVPQAVEVYGERVFARGGEMEAKDMGYGAYGGYAGRMSSSGPMPSESDESKELGLRSRSAREATSRPVDQLESRVQTDLKASDSRVLAAIRRHEADRAAQIARLREQLSYRPVQQARKPQKPAPPAVLSEAEIARQEEALNAAYKIFQGIRQKYPGTRTAEQSRGEIKVMIDHWRTIVQWQRAALLGELFLKDNPTDRELPGLRLSIARDYLAWASGPVEDKPSKQSMLAEVSRRFTKARDLLEQIVVNFPKEQALLQEAQWDVANSFLTQARVVDAFSPTLARGQYVRATKELQHLSDEYHDHPKVGSVPQMLWDISGELAGRDYYDEAITVWNDLKIRYPTHGLAQEAALRIARAYQNNLHQPLRAAEAYQEVNVARGGRDTGIQNEIYRIGVQLKDKKRWVEALHVLQMFVDSFPRHPQAGQALTMIGQVHQTNEAWEEAIAAYRRVIAEFPSGNWVREAKWAIAECTINLSQWQQAMDGYQDYRRDYPDDARAKEAERRVAILKDLVRYQALVDEKDQRKAFDAQYQIATIVLNQLSNRVKAIIEYRKMAANWPQSHLADDSVYAVGTTYLAMEETEKAREALKIVAREYPDSPLADDALYMVGKSYEDEANRFAAATRATTVKKAEEVAQRLAYRFVQDTQAKQRQEQRERIDLLRQKGKGSKAEFEEARAAGHNVAFDIANVELAAERAGQVVEALTAVQLANRQDKINAALRKAVRAYNEASKVPAGDKAGDALLRMATIYDQRLKDSGAAMAAWLEIVRQFSGTAVAEDASWRIARYYEREGKYAQAIEAYKAFLRNYRRSPKAGAAQLAVAESYEHLGQWVNAMDAYTNYINNFPNEPMVEKAREQINWIKAYRL